MGERRDNNSFGEVGGRKCSATSERMLPEKANKNKKLAHI